MVEEGRRKPLGSIRRVAMLTVLEVSSDDPLELGIEEKAARKTVHQRRETGYRRPEQKASRLEDSRRLFEGLCPVCSGRQMIERTKEQNRVV